MQSPASSVEEPAESDQRPAPADGEVGGRSLEPCCDGGVEQSCRVESQQASLSGQDHPAQPEQEFVVAGYWGRGLPIQAVYKGRSRPIHDGGGLCSPGRWPIKQRQFPQSQAFAKARTCVCRSFMAWLKQSDEQGNDALKLFWSLAAGKRQRSPFEAAALQRARAELDGVLRAEGVCPDRQATDRQTEINFRRVAALLELAGDPDFAFLNELASVGACLGVGEVLPRVPAVFEAKTRWKLSEPGGDFEPTVCANYKSAEENMEDIRRQIVQELHKGTVVSMTKSEAQRKFGNKLAVAALGAVPKEVGTSEVRIIHDATHNVEVNPRIRVRDQIRCPRIDDLDGLLRLLVAECSRDPTIRFCLKYDVSRAHKLVPIREEDWAYQAFSLDDPDIIYMHTVGAFGLASAAYHWARVAAAIVRLSHYMSDVASALYHLLYSDDGLLLATGKDFWRRQMFWLYVFELLEVPLSWKKVAGGASLSWIGYQVDVVSYQSGIGPTKVGWLVRWIDDHLREGRVQVRHMRAALGRFSFIAGALPHVRPFLGPIFAWCAAQDAGESQLLLGVRLILEHIRHEVVCASMTPPRPLPTQVGELFRVDAKAQGDKIVIGGWECLGSVGPKDARWFSVKLDRTTAPWAYVKGDPYRTIAALELMATLVAVCVFGHGAVWKGAVATATVAGFTDNMGNSFVVDKHMTTAFPLCVVLMELSVQLKDLGCTLNLGWVPREQNTEADALTNEDFTAFDPAKRMQVEPGNLGFRVMPRLMEAAMQLDSEIKLSRRKRGPPKAGRAKSRGVGLRWADPW